MLRKPIQKIPREKTKKEANQKIEAKETGKPNILKHTNVKLKASTSSKKEENSMNIEKKFPRDSSVYKKMLDLPEYHPTTAEFKQPLNLIRKLKEMGYEKIGAVKIIPPKSWKPEFSFNNSDKKLTTRIQFLRELSKGIAFEQNVDAYTQDEFKELADSFAKKYKYKTSIKSEDQYRINEYEYWSLIEDPQYDKNRVEVEYAADLPSRKYGSGFPQVYRGRATDELDPSDESTHPFNLNNIGHAKDSLFQIITRKMENISGITSPWVYSGMLFASFCWHVEDLYMYSLNYMHVGEAKTWYCVSAEYKEEFDKVFKTHYKHLFDKNPAVMYGITLAMNPAELIEKNIPVFRTEQKPGEFILTFPRVYHSGFSHGYNVSEAVNVATSDWMPEGRAAVKAYSMEGFMKKMSFPYEWLIVENITRYDEFEYSKLAKAELFAEYKTIIENEIRDRTKIKEIYPKMITKQFENNLNRYDYHMCSVCKNYCYLSYLQCSRCSKKACVQHISTCTCLNPNIVLNIRFTEKEMNDHLEDEKSNKKTK